MCDEYRLGDPFGDRSKRDQIAPSHYVTCAAHLTLNEPPIRAATWIASAAALRFHAAAQIAHCERS